MTGGDPEKYLVYKSQSRIRAADVETKEVDAERMLHLNLF